MFTKRLSRNYNFIKKKFKTSLQLYLFHINNNYLNNLKSFNHHKWLESLFDYHLCRSGLKSNDTRWTSHKSWKGRGRSRSRRRRRRRRRRKGMLIKGGGQIVTKWCCCFFFLLLHESLRHRQLLLAWIQCVLAIGTASVEFLLKQNQITHWIRSPIWLELRFH